MAERIAMDKQAPDADPVILRRDLQRLIGVHSDTMRLWIKAGKLPPPDVHLSRVTKGLEAVHLDSRGNQDLGGQLAS